MGPKVLDVRIWYLCGAVLSISVSTEISPNNIPSPSPFEPTPTSFLNPQWKPQFHSTHHSFRTNASCLTARCRIQRNHVTAPPASVPVVMPPTSILNVSRTCGTVKASNTGHCEVNPPKCLWRAAASGRPRTSGVSWNRHRATTRRTITSHIGCKIGILSGNMSQSGF